MLGLDKNKKYLLACSYGPDSMALFKLLLDEGYCFEVAHVNYHLRDESNLEMYNLSKFCGENNIKIHILEVEENAIKSNIEKVCREIRYNYFKSIYENFDSLLVAHNQDDLIETYLLQKKRNGVVQWYGLKEKNIFNGMTVERPLLGYSKAELLSLCDKTRTPYNIDKTNLEDIHERNKIRHSIVQKMGDEQRTEILKEIDEANKKLSSLINRISNLDTLNVEVLQGFDDYTLSIALHLEARKTEPRIELSRARVKEIRKILLSEKPNIKTYVFDNVILLKEYNRILFLKEECEKGFEYILNSPGELDTPYFYLNFTNGSNDRNIDSSDYPITIRSATPEDVIKVKNYSKTFRRLCIDWKIPLLTRKRYPLIVNKMGMIKYIPRYRKDFEIKEGINFYLK